MLFLLQEAAEGGHGVCEDGEEGIRGEDGRG